jgi:hypothetical protein
MYVDKGKRMTSAQVLAFMKSELAELEKQGEWSKALYKKVMRGLSESGLISAANSLAGLNDALMSGRSVYAVCDKEPRGNLDTGAHYYSVWWVDEMSITHALYLGSFGLLLGAEVNNRVHYLSDYVWRSSAIGMSRLLDATDGIFSFLKRAGGCYAQIACVN